MLFAGVLHCTQYYTVTCEAIVHAYTCTELMVSLFILEYRVSWVRVPPEAARKSDCLGCAVLLCLVCLFDLACFFLSSFSSLIKNMYTNLYMCLQCFGKNAVTFSLHTITIYVNITSRPQILRTSSKIIPVHVHAALHF